MYLKHPIAILFSILLISSTLQAQRSFIKRFGTSDSEYGTAITLTKDTGILMCQTVAVTATNNIYLGIVKTDANGFMLWNKVYGDSDKTVAKSVQQLDDGFIILATTWNNGSSHYLVLMRINDVGDLIWTKEYSGSVSDSASGLSIHNNQFYVTATADYNSGTNPKLLWFKTDTAGTVLNYKLYRAPQNLTSISSAVNDSGKTGVVCESNSFGIGSPNLNNLVSLQLDTTGTIEWSQSIGTRYEDEAADMSFDGTDWLITGRSKFLNFFYDLSIFRVDAGGNLASQAFYDAGNTDGEAGRSIITGDNNSCIIAGDAGSAADRNMNLAVFDQNGNVAWAMKYNVSAGFTNYPYDLVALKNDSGFLFTGDLSLSAVQRDAAIFRTTIVGDAGCFSSALVYTKRTDTVLVVGAPLTDVPFTLSENTITGQLQNITLFDSIKCQPITADFSFKADTDCPFIHFLFTDESIGATSWEWEFPHGHPSSSTQPGPIAVDYDTSGVFAIKLKINNGADSVIKTITLDHICDTVFIPNAVTPNGDYQNDQFAPKNLPDNFHLTIYNRWGNQIFETTDKNKMWPEKPGSDEVHDGVYYYVLDILPPAKTRSYHGNFSIFNGKN